ncbi:MAG: DUF4070 domain-containing protein [Spirochaetes bacterium]|nr:MAG: DUF4070 domain-containing protein [Spirochaetota bacterium]
MHRKILMIYPEFPTTYWSFKHSLAFVNKKSSIIPLGLITVASLLPEDWESKLVDMNVEPLRREDVEDADMVFLSAMIVQRRSFDEVVRLCNECGTPVVAGGPFPTALHGEISGVDHFVLNEAETTLPGFIRDYEAGNAKHLYESQERPDITKTPAPRFDLVDFSKYQNAAIQNSRGCPYNCEFCDIIELFGRNPRFKDPDQFVREMDLAYRNGARGSIFIVDDNFIGNKRKVKELLRKIIEWQREHAYPFALFTEASVDLAADDELLALMVEAGFDMVFVGIETPDAAALAECSKGQNLRSGLFESVEKIQRAGIEVTAGFIVGFDSDGDDIFDRQIDFIQRAGIPMAMVGLLSAITGTQLYRRLEKEGRLKADNNWQGSNTNDLQLTFVPRMPEARLVEGYKKIIATIYSPRRYFERCRVFIDRLPAASVRTDPPLTMTDIRAFFLSLVKQTFSRYGLSYLRFLARVALRNPSAFALAVRFAIKGYHLFIMTRDILKADEYSTYLGRVQGFVRESIARLGAISESVHALEVEKIEKRLALLVKTLGRKYRRLNGEMRIFYAAQFREAQAFFSGSISSLKKNSPY